MAVADTGKQGSAPSGATTLLLAPQPVPGTFSSPVSTFPLRPHQGRGAQDGSVPGPLLFPGGASLMTTQKLDQRLQRNHLPLSTTLRREECLFTSRVRRTGHLKPSQETGELQRGRGGRGESVNPFRSAGLTVLQPLVGRENCIYQNHSMGLVGTAFST